MKKQIRHCVAVKTALVGHTPTGYILWHSSSRKFLESKHAIFLESLVYKKEINNERDESNKNE